MLFLNIVFTIEYTFNISNCKSVQLYIAVQTFIAACACAVIIFFHKNHDNTQMYLSVFSKNCHTVPCIESSVLNG